MRQLIVPARWLCSVVVVAACVTVSASLLAQARPTAIKYDGPQCFATVLPDVTASNGRITAGLDPTMQIFAAGDTVFVRPGGDGVRAGETYLLYRVDGEVRHPRTHEVIGSAINLLGRIEITQVDDERAMGRILETCAEIERGDDLHPLLAGRVGGNVAYPPIGAEHLLAERESDATVVHGHSESLARGDGYTRQGLGNWATYAAGDVVTLDQGTLEGWQPDSRVILYSSRPEAAAPDDLAKTDPVVRGQGVVIYALEHTSVVMITDGAGTVRLGTRARRMDR